MAPGAAAAEAVRSLDAKVRSDAKERQKSLAAGGSRKNLLGPETKEESALDAAILTDIIRTITPPIADATIERLARVLVERQVSLSLIKSLTSEDLKADPFLIMDPIDRARILSGVAGASCGPPPVEQLGGPAIVRPKIGFSRLGEIDTLTATASGRFFVDHYWRDPRMVGQSYVPDGIWRPEGVYIANQYGTLDCMTHVDRPTIADADAQGCSTGGLLLWPTEYDGTLVNPMTLHEFPFDHDSLDIYIHQAEHASSEEYVFRGFDSDDDEQSCVPSPAEPEPLRDAQPLCTLHHGPHIVSGSLCAGRSVRFFFSIFETLSEWQLRGFSKMAWESVGGIPTPFSKIKVTLHMTRNYSYYAWKIVLPLLICTLFCFASFAFVPSEIEARVGISTTMFLATAALLYVIGTEVPKVSYLTTIDKLVVSTLVVQFLIVVVCVISGGSIYADAAGDPRSLWTSHKPVAEAIDIHAMWILALLLLLSLVAFFVWPAYVYHRQHPNLWPTTLWKGNGGALKELLRTTGDGKTCNQGWLWTPDQPAGGVAAGQPTPLSVRYLRFTNFVNVYPTSEPGAEPPGRRPDPPNMVADNMRTMIAGEEAVYAGHKAVEKTEATIELSA